jgi:hypothetical protein
MGELLLVEAAVDPAEDVGRDLASGHAKPATREQAVTGPRRGG